MAKHPGMPISAEHVTARHWVADIVYFPLETELLRHARRLGCRTLSGEGMAIFQAVRAFELFTGIQPDVDRMKAAFAAFDRVPAG
jgi:shikimate dehydrogenase